MFHGGGGFLGREVVPLLKLFDERREHLELQEVAQEVAAFAGQHRFRVELDAVHGERLVPHTHDRAVVGARGGLERFRKRIGDDERVITAGGKRLGDAAKRYGPEHPRLIAAQAEFKAAQENVRRQVASVIQTVSKDYEAAKANEESMERALARGEGSPAPTRATNSRARASPAAAVGSDRA